MCTPINITDSLLRCHCDKASNSSYGDEFILHCWHAYPWDSGLSDTSLFVRLDPIEYLRKTSNVSVLLPAICILGLCVLLIVFIFIHAYRHRQLRCSKHQKPWITLATILGIEKLEKIACKLKLTKEMAYVRGQLESQVFGYAMAILAVHLYGIEHQHEQPPENILKPTTEDTTFVLGLELPGSKKTVLQVLMGHEDEVFSATFSYDGGRIVTASKDNTCRVWSWLHWSLGTSVDWLFIVVLASSRSHETSIFWAHRIFFTSCWLRVTVRFGLLCHQVIMDMSWLLSCLSAYLRITTIQAALLIVNVNSSSFYSHHSIDLSKSSSHQNH